MVILFVLTKMLKNQFFLIDFLNFDYIFFILYLFFLHLLHVLQIEQSHKVVLDTFLDTHLTKQCVLCVFKVGIRWWIQSEILPAGPGSAAI